MKKFCPSKTLFLSKQHASLFLLVSLFVFISNANAEDIFKWKDKDGRVYYSNSPLNPEDKPAKLPKLHKEDLDKKIEKIKSETPENCHAHGGIDCNQGADQDGSVICLDGFRDAILPHRFYCLETRLSTQLFLRFAGDPPEIEAFQKPLKKLIKGRRISSLMVSVRNLRGIKAEEVLVSISFPGNSSSLRAIGPRNIESFGLADYVVPIRATKSYSDLRNLEKTRYKVSCINCRSILQGNKPQ